MTVATIKALRKLNGLNQHEFAEVVGVSRALIAIVETNKHSFMLERKIKETFGESQVAVVQLTMKAIEVK